MFSGLYLHNDVTCQKMRTRFCNLTIKDSKNVNLKVPAQNQKRRKLVTFKVDWSQKRLHGHVDFNVSQIEKIQLKTDRAEEIFLSNVPII